MGFKEKADLNLTKSIEKEKVRDFFLENNDGWQMHTLTRNVNEDEKRRQQMEDDEKTALIRDGDERRQGAVLVVYEVYSYFARRRAKENKKRKMMGIKKCGGENDTNNLRDA